MPPIAVTVIVPFVSLKQETCVDVAAAPMAVPGSVIITVLVVVQPLASVIVAV